MRLPSSSCGTSFQPTLPARGATRPWWEEATVSKMISTHAPRTGSDLAIVHLLLFLQISTHAPRTGSDGFLDFFNVVGDISTHAPRTGSDSVSVRQAIAFRNFNPRSPHGERPLSAIISVGARAFQPTLPARGAT